ncbi:proton channel OtopLc isoform X2 [Culicoides brevitarsis]|uniref:proton channel OtopLc isoform X2 n=1 Tax=Culicoides brevitarsis TaxID=469753 RepID=UPI00307B4742
MVGEPKSVSAVESGDNMATLPVSKAHTSSGDSIEKNNAANKEMELKNVMPNPSQKTSLFIVTSLVYAMILVVVCVSYVISDVTTHRIPEIYYEGFFTYLYGASILFLLYVFCFLLQESACCSGGSAPKKPKEKKPKKQKSKKGDEEGKAGKDGKGKASPYQEDTADVEAAVVSPSRQRKTTQDAHGSFFLRIGAIAFGVGTMIWTGLEIGTFFETPLTSPCHQILKGVNPLLQMIFTFLQMYFIFMNSRVILNIHRFKVVARFGLMHVVATNLCVWIRTLVMETLKEITNYYHNRTNPEDNVFLEHLRQNIKQNEGLILGEEQRTVAPDMEWEPVQSQQSFNFQDVGESNLLQKIVQTTVGAVETTTREFFTNPTTTTTTMKTTTTTVPSTTTRAAIKNVFEFLTTPSTTPSTTTTTTTTEATTEATTIASTIASTLKTTAATSTEFFREMIDDGENYLNYRKNATSNLDSTFESLDALFPEPLFALPSSHPNGTHCGKINIMGTIVKDSSPYLYPFIIEYSLIGAVVLYVMWKHIGRYQKSTTGEDLERRLEVMLSRRAVALAQSQTRVDCVGASKGLFFGLLLLVGSLICLILYFVLVRHPQLSVLAIRLADVSHTALLILTILAILIGFCRVSLLKFRIEDQSNLNDILLRISAFGLFVYASFSIIAGALNVMESEPNLLVLVTHGTSVLQVVLQLLFISDVSRRRVHLPEHDRSKPGRQIVTFLLICNISMFVIYTLELQKVFANPVQLDFYGYICWCLIQRVTLPLCIFHRFHSAVTLAEVWKTTYKARLE